MLGTITTERTRFPLWLGCALAMLFMLNAAAAVALLRPPQFAMVLDPSQIRPELGAAWLAPVPLGNIVFNADGDRDAPQRSNLRLFENQAELKPGQSLHADIREKGAGHFSHWHQWIYFSTSDGTDPRSNGRTYSVSVAGALSTNLLLALALVNLTSFSLLRPVLIHRYGGSKASVSSSESVSILSPLTLAALVTAAAFCLAWFCGFAYRTNDDPTMRLIAEGATSGHPSEFLIYQNVIAGLVLRTLSSVAPHVPWYDLVLTAGTAAGALLLLTALLRLCRSRHQATFCALVGFIGFAGVFRNLQFSAAAIVLAGGAMALLASVAYRPPASPKRVRACVVAAVVAFFWGSLFRFEGTLLAAGLVAPILLLATRQRVLALRLPLLGLAAGIALAVSGKAFDIAYYHFTPGWEDVQAVKSQRLRVSEYLVADFSREAEMKAALSAVGWSRNDLDLISGWMFAVPDTFETKRVARFAEFAPKKSWVERIDMLRQAISVSGRETLWLFAALCVLGLVMVRSLYAAVVVLVSATWFTLVLIALSLMFKPTFLHVLWAMCGTGSLVVMVTALAGSSQVRRTGYYLLEDKVVTAGVFVALCVVALWQISDMRARTRADNEVRARLVPDLAAWPDSPNTKVVAWDANFPFETWVRPFHALSEHARLFFYTTHSSVTPLMDRTYATWGTRDALWAMCHVPGTYLVDAHRGYIARHTSMLVTYMREHHAQAVTLVPAFEGQATSLLACRPIEKKE